MTITLMQTDAAADCGAVVGCSGGVIAATPQARQATERGTAGTGTASASILPSSTAAAVMFQSAGGEPGLSMWQSGVWVVRLNVTVANNRLDWVATHVCRFSAACGNLATVASLTGQSINLGTTGVKSMAVTGASQSAALTDTIYVVLTIKNLVPVGTQSFSFVPDQTIGTPLSSGIVVMRRRMEDC